MKNTSLLFLYLMFGVLSCNIHSTSSQESVEIWRTDLKVMKSETNEFTDKMEEHSQYLYLYSNGEAQIIDSLQNGTIRESETKWEIRKKNGKDIFLLGFGKESQGIMGVAFPIIFKNETDFKMAFDSLQEHHIWNLKRIK